MVQDNFAGSEDAHLLSYTENNLSLYNDIGRHEHLLLRRTPSYWFHMQQFLPPHLDKPAWEPNYYILKSMKIMAKCNNEFEGWVMYIIEELLKYEFPLCFGRIFIIQGGF